MQQVARMGRVSARNRGRTVRVVGVAVGLAAVLGLAACSGGGSGKQSSSPAAQTTSPGGSPTAPSSSTPPPAPAAVITTSAATTQISPNQPVSVQIAHGKLTSVVMTNATGKQVSGQLATDGTSWTSNEDLGYGKTYKIVASGVNADGVKVSKTSDVTTLTPGNQTALYLDRTGDYALTDGATYGVAILPEMYFDEQIVTKADKEAAAKAVTVVTTPHIDGAWAWQDNQRMLWRPQNYWPSGTKVTINAKIYGVKLGDGLYGQADKSLSFTIGRKQLTIATDSAPAAVNKVRVYNAAGQVIRTMNTSMGEHGGVTVNGKYINFYTLDGTYTVLEHDNPAYMSSDSYGLPASSPQGYASEPIYWSTKISVDGIYLHELNTTIWAQNSGQDVSHGCLNLPTDDAQWFFQNSLIGDPVVVKGNPNAPKIQVWQGGGWSVPWSAWLTGDVSNY